MRVSIRKLKAHFSSYPAQAHEGMALEITSHRKVVARVTGMPKSASARATASRMARDWRYFLIIEITQAVAKRAGEFAETFALRGYDSVQLASAYETLVVAPGEARFACFDNRLSKAARVLGFGIL